MVKLTEYEKKMLDGEMGEFKQTAIQNIVKYAEVLGATELCEVNKATLFFGAHNYLEVVKSDDYEEIFSKMYMCSDKTLKMGKFASECYSADKGSRMRYNRSLYSLSDGLDSPERRAFCNDRIQ